MMMDEIRYLPCWILSINIYSVPHFPLKDILMIVISIYWWRSEAMWIYYSVTGWWEGFHRYFLGVFPLWLLRDLFLFISMLWCLLFLYKWGWCLEGGGIWFILMQCEFLVDGASLLYEDVATGSPYLGDDITHSIMWYELNTSCGVCTRKLWY